MATFLMVHGAFRGGWAWGPVAARLRVRGHEAHAPDLPGAGARWRPGHLPVGLGDVLDALEEEIVARDLHELLLVGHSQGGFVARALTQRVANRVQRLLLLDAPVPAHGQRAVDLVPSGNPDGPPLPPRDLWVQPTPISVDGAGGDPVAAARWSARLTPLSVALALDPVVLDDEAALAIPERRAFCEDTPPGFPSWHTRADMDESGRDYDLLAAPHDAPLAVPGLVADWLVAHA